LGSSFSQPSLTVSKNPQYVIDKKEARPVLTRVLAVPHQVLYHPVCICSPAHCAFSNHLYTDTDLSMRTCNQAAVLMNGGIFHIKAPFPLPPGSVLGNPSWHGVFRGTAGGGTDSASGDGHQGDDDEDGDQDEQHRVFDMYAMLNSLPVAPTTGSAAQPSKSRTTLRSGGASHQRHCHALQLRC
jgi:hypothetical protein